MKFPSRENSDIRTNVGSSMNLPEAEAFIREVENRFGYTDINITRVGGKVKFYDISIRLKVN